MTTAQRGNQTRARLAVLTLASAALLVAGPAAADEGAPSAASRTGVERPHPAHRVVHRDARRDVLHFDVESEATRPAPRDRGTDITRTVVDHQRDRVVVHTRVRHLVRSGYRLMVVDLATPRGRYELMVDYSRTPIGTRLTLERSGTGADVDCADASWSLRRGTDEIRASVPTSCLRDPRWIRAGIGVVSAPHDLTTSRADDSRTRGRVSHRSLALGPRQPRA